MKLSKSGLSFSSLIALRRRAARDEHQLFYAEGVRPLIEAAQSSFPLEAVFYCPSLLANQFAQRLIRRLRKRGVPCSQLTLNQYQELAHSAEPQGIIVVARQTWTPLAQADPDAGSCWLAVDEIRSPGNLGTMIRSAESFGAAGLILLSDQLDPFDPPCLRASMGALFNIQLVRATPHELLAWKTRHNCQLVGTSPQGVASLFRFAFAPRPILWMGGERRGLPAQYQELCEAILKIPHCGRSDSLNVAIATGICLAEIYRQQREF